MTTDDHGQGLSKRAWLLVIGGMLLIGILNIIIGYFIMAERDATVAGQPTEVVPATDAAQQSSKPESTP